MGSITYAVFLALLIANLLGGCAVMDAMLPCQYVGIYTDRNKHEQLTPDDFDRRFDRFLDHLAGSTGYGVRDILNGDTRMVELVFPKEHRTSLDRVVISRDTGEEISISIIKEAKGEDDDVIRMKRSIEKSFAAVGLTKWRCYVQRSYGQLWNGS